MGPGLVCALPLLAPLYFVVVNMFSIGNAIVYLSLIYMNHVSK